MPAGLLQDRAVIFQRKCACGASTKDSGQCTECQSKPPVTVERETGPGLIVNDDAVELAPGQMRKREFLDQLRETLCAVADAELAATRRNTQGCPYIAHWLAYYQTRDAQYLLRAIRRYAPETAELAAALDYISAITERARRAVAIWANTGRISGVPEMAEPEGEATKPTTQPASDLQFKARGVDTAGSADPQFIRDELGPGHSLDSGVSSRMSAAFRHSFSNVRVHTGAKASSLSEQLDARAFTMGCDIAFGADEYRPGTMIGDALIAHELAHVLQQQGGVASSAREPAKGESNTLEQDADRSAISAVISLWGGLKGTLLDVASSAMPRLKSGLRLSTCRATANPCSMRTVPESPVKRLTVRHTHLAGGKESGAFNDDLAYTNKVWALAGIRFAAGKEETLGVDETRELLGSPPFLNEGRTGEPHVYTPEEIKLLVHSYAPGEATAYYIEDFETLKANGATYKTYNGIVIAKKAPQRTFAHEVGHLLIGPGGHDSVDANIMAWSGVATGEDCLSDTQIDTARKSDLPK
jgi:hypothetical protein